MAEMIVAIKLTPDHKGAGPDSSSNDAKSGVEVKHDPNLDIQLRDILSKMFSYQGSIVLCFPDIPNEQVKKNADHIRKLQGDDQVQLLSIQIKKSVYDQIKEAKDSYNSSAGPNDPSISLVRIITRSQQDILAVKKESDGDSGIKTNHQVYFKKKVTTDMTEHDNDPSTFFVKFRYIEDGQAKTRFVNCHAWLAMGTAEQAEMGKTTQLFSMGDPNISLTHDTKKNYGSVLALLAQDFVNEDPQVRSANLFYFIAPDDTREYPLQPPNPGKILTVYEQELGIMKLSDGQEPNAVIGDNPLEFILTEE